MVAATDPFSAWLAEAQLSPQRLTPDQRALLLAVFRFRQRQGHDYYSTRLLSHFLLHSDSGLKVAALARLLGISRPTASRQQGLSSKQTVQQARHRMDGRPYGKLLPRYAGPIAQFLLSHPHSSRADLIDFVDHTFGVRVSRIALYRFLKKFGLDALPDTRPEATAALPQAAVPPLATARPLDRLPPPSTPTAPPFCSDARSMRAPS